MPESVQPVLPEHLYFVVEFQPVLVELLPEPEQLLELLFELLQEQVLLPELEQELEPVLLQQVEELLLQEFALQVPAVRKADNTVEPELAGNYKLELADKYNKALLVEHIEVLVDQYLEFPLMGY